MVCLVARRRAAPSVVHTFPSELREQMRDFLRGSVHGKTDAVELPKCERKRCRVALYSEGLRREFARRFGAALEAARDRMRSGGSRDSALAAAGLATGKVASMSTLAAVTTKEGLKIKGKTAFAQFAENTQRSQSFFLSTVKNGNRCKELDSF